MFILSIVVAFLYNLCLLPATSCAQDLNLEPRTIPVKVLDKKGRPMKSITLNYFSSSIIVATE